MDENIKQITSGLKKITLTEKPKEMPRLPPIKACKVCHYNPGSDDTGLCATCDPNHKWWVRK